MVVSGEGNCHPWRRNMPSPNKAHPICVHQAKPTALPSPHTSRAPAPEQHAVAGKRVHGVGLAGVVDQRSLGEDAHRQRPKLVVTAARMRSCTTVSKTWAQQLGKQELVATAASSDRSCGCCLWCSQLAWVMENSRWMHHCRQ